MSVNKRSILPENTQLENKNFLKSKNTEKLIFESSFLNKSIPDFFNIFCEIEDLLNPKKFKNQCLKYNKSDSKKLLKKVRYLKEHPFFLEKE